MDTMNTREMISALADGQLQGDAFARGVESAAGDDASLSTWHAYHLIGEVLRSGDCSPASQPSAFLQRFQSRLAAEPAPATIVAVAAQPAMQGAAVAANDGSFRWKVVAGFASAAAVTAVGWALVSSPMKSEQAQLAAASAGTAAVVATTPQGVMIRDARLDEFLAAHRQLGNASALPTPAGFLRNATFEGPAR